MFLFLATQYTFTLTIIDHLTKRSQNTSTDIYALATSVPLASINTAMMQPSALLGKVRLSSFICSISREALQNVIVLLYALSDFR